MISLEALRAEMAAAGDPERAAGQQRYMKSAIPYHGLTTPELRSLLRQHLKGFRPLDRADWERTVRHFWDDATHREERYAAIALARHRTARQWQDVDTLELNRHLVVTGAWWDVVDVIAQHLVGAVLAADRPAATRVLRTWAVDHDLWLRRTSVICQLAHGSDTDLDLLTFAIERNLDDPSFWLRKAIGSALRQHARVDPEWVRAYVASLGDRLSGLSRREATRHL
ncbi:MAG: DNA alkylation repair protein [Nocardioides sp.]|nr:DNA alkylation repair protein [Nocardioides sp.]